MPHASTPSVNTDSVDSTSPKTSASRGAILPLGMGLVLVRDISAVLADLKINIQGMNTHTFEGDGIADMNLKITVKDLEELSLVLARMQGLPNVLNARRKS